MIVLVLDPATSTGYCLVDINQDEMISNIYEYGFLDVDTSSNYQGDHCINLMDRIQDIIDDHGVEHIAIEDYFFNKRFASGCNVNAAYRTAIHILARQNEMDYTILNITSWKTFVAGRSTPTREQKRVWGAEAAKKLYIQQALWERYGFKFPNHSVSDNTGKPIAFRYDIVDVVGQAVYYCRLVRGVPKITMSVKAVDVPMRMLKKRIFEYPSS